MTHQFEPPQIFPKSFTDKFTVDKKILLRNLSMKRVQKDAFMGFAVGTRGIEATLHREHSVLYTELLVIFHGLCDHDDCGCLSLALSRTARPPPPLGIAPRTPTKKRAPASSTTTINSSNPHRPRCFLRKRILANLMVLPNSLLLEFEISRLGWIHVTARNVQCNQIICFRATIIWKIL